MTDAAKNIPTPRKRILLIDWLTPCPYCESKTAIVKSVGRKDFLYEGDPVKCSGCRMKGVIEVFDEESVDCVWDEIGLAKRDV